MKFYRISKVACQQESLPHPAQIQLNNSQIRYKIDNGENSLSKFRSIWIWYLRSMLPGYLGGFKNKTI